MKTTVGGSDVSDIVEQLKLWMQSQQPATPPSTPPVDLTGVTLVMFGFLGLGCFYMFMKHRTNWGHRW